MLPKVPTRAIVRYRPSAFKFLILNVKTMVHRGGLRQVN
jgi:hypothetical protein